MSRGLLLLLLIGAAPPVLATPMDAPWLDNLALAALAIAGLIWGLRAGRAVPRPRDDA